jgi:hypothetical protein
MGFATTKDYVDNANSGSRVRSSFYKIFTSSAAATAGRWYDISMANGDPQPNIYPVTTPLAATQLNYTDRGNLWHGVNRSPETKHLKSALIYSTSATAAPSVFLLCDFLLYYPLIKPNLSTTVQTFNNTITLPRYTTGEGVRMFLVAVSDLGTVTTSIVVNYQNSDGVDDRIAAGSFYVPTLASYPLNIAASSPLSSIVHSAANTSGCFAPFIPLCPLCNGVRKVNSIQFLNGMGGGTCALVLVKPLAYIPCVTVSVPSERDYFIDIPSLPRIYDGAFLNVLMLAGAAVPINSIYQGYIEYIGG